MSETLSANQDFSTSSPGAILKRCREFHSISISEAAEATKIGANYLTALENDRINEFANIAYLKGFLRIYSNYLSLNADDMVRLFERLYEPVGDQKNNKTGSVGDKTLKLRNWFSWQKLAMPLVLLILLIITATIFNRSPAPIQQPHKIEQPVVQTPAIQPILSSASKTISRQKNKDTSSPPETTKKEEVTVERKETVKAATETAKSFFVRMRVIQNSKLAVTIDGAATQSYDLNSGDIIEWKAANNIILELSNSGGVEAELNGKSLKSFGPIGKPVYVVIDADGVK